MPGRLRLFVSIGPDLEPEREYIGQAVAHLPTSLGWAIDYTPSLQERRGVDPGPIQNCDFHLILLGIDITAPVGWELWTARRAGKRSLGFVKEVGRSPAAAIFLRESGLSWSPFRAPADLLPLLQQALAQRLVEDPGRYGLNLTELETLSAFLKEQQGSTRARSGGEEVLGSGAGRAGVILSPGHDLPAGGVLVGGKQKAGSSREGS